MSVPRSWDVASTSAEYTQLVVDFGYGDTAMVPISIREDGEAVLAAVPSDALEPEALASAEEENYAGWLGPNMMASVPPHLPDRPEEVDATATPLNVLIIDLLYSPLAVGLFSNVDEEEVTGFSADRTEEEEGKRWPWAEGLWLAAQKMLPPEGNVRAPRLQQYLTAESGGSEAARFFAKAKAKGKSFPRAKAKAKAPSTVELAAQVNALSSQMPLILAALQDLQAPRPVETALPKGSPPAYAKAPGRSLTLLGTQPGLGGLPALPKVGFPSQAMVSRDPPAGPRLGGGTTLLSGGATSEPTTGQPGREDEIVDAETEGQDTLIRLLAKQTQILESMRRPRDPLGVLLGGGSELGPGGGPAGARGAAAMELHHEELLRYPERISAMVRRNMARALGTDPSAAQDAEEYLRRFGAFQRQRSLGYVFALLANVWNKMELEQTAAAQAALGLALVAIEQVTIDNRWDLAYLLTHSPDPPWNAIDRTPTTDAMRPFSRLADPRWIASGIAYIRDVDAMAERRRKADIPKDQNVKPKSKGSGGPKGGGGSGKGPEGAKEE
jgi:hypothetical protein